MPEDRSALVLAIGDPRKPAEGDLEKLEPLEDIVDDSQPGIIAPPAES